MDKQDFALTMLVISVVILLIGELVMAFGG